MLAVGYVCGRRSSLWGLIWNIKRQLQRSCELRQTSSVIPCFYSATKTGALLDWPDQGYGLYEVALVESELHP